MSDCGSHRAPRLFVYNLSDSYRMHGRSARAADGRNFSFPGYPAHEPLNLHEMYDVATLFFQRALHYRCRVTDAQLADIFYVPAWNTDMVSHPSSACAERPRGADVHHSVLYHRMSLQAPGALEARGGADHILLTPRPGAWYYESFPMCELDLLDPRFGAAARLSIEQQPPRSELMPRGPFGYYADLAFLSVPYPSWVRLRLDSVRRGSTQQTARDTVEEVVPWRHRHARHVHVAAAFGTGHGSPLIVALRQRLKDLCTGARDAEGTTACVYTSPPSKSHKHAASPASQPPFHVTAAQLYWNATFCLMPGGDSATRKATLDALLLGCIPVLFHQGQVEQWIWHWGSWRDEATITFNHSDVMATAAETTLDPIARLIAMDEKRIVRMQRAISAHAHLMHWASPGNANSVSTAFDDGSRGFTHDAEPDAFDVTLRSVALRAADAAIVARGREVQDSKGTQRAMALEGFVNVTADFAAAEGLCKLSTGAFTKATCVGSGNDIFSWTEHTRPKPLLRAGVPTVEACISLCQQCQRCQWVSYSLMLKLCSWSPSCDVGNLDRRYEMWTYKSFRLTKSNK